MPRDPLFVPSTRRAPRAWNGRARARGRCGGTARPHGEEGFTLIEVLVTMAVLALMMGGMLLGTGAPQRARLRSAATLTASAIRVAYQHASATSKDTRLVFDFEERRIVLEQASGKLALVKGEVAGGAEGATDEEREAIAAADEILKGPRAPRPRFEPARAFGFDAEDQATGRELPSGIRFRQIEVENVEEPITTGRAYLYFWPGGQTQRAAVQLVYGEGDDDDHIVTVIVSPLTGKVEVKSGKQALERPTDDDEASEREDTGS